MFDIHGKEHGDEPEYRGSVIEEIYNNKFVLGQNLNSFMIQRGGTLLMYDNHVTGGTGLTGLTEYRGWYFCTADGYPKQDQINNSYIYNNSGVSPHGSAIHRITNAAIAKPIPAPVRVPLISN